ncbi:MAG TPA: hypothetical protein VIZ60_00650 [Rubrobacter sp.]
MSGLAGRLVRLYPRAWRERYEEEFVAMLEQGPVTIKDLFDVVFGAVDAWLRPQVVYEGRLVMVSRMRGSVLAVLWAWVGLVVAGVGFRKMTEYDDFVRAARDSALVGVAFDTVVVGAVVALAAVAVGGAPVAFAALRKALAERRKDVLLLCMPLIFGAGFVGYILVLMKVIYPALGRVAVHGTVNVALFLSLVGAFSLAALASAWAVTAAVRRVEVGGRTLRFVLYPAAVAAAGMAVVLVGTTVWGVTLRATAPTLFSGDDGILATPTYVTWLAIVAVMAVSTAVAVVVSICGLRARNVGHASSRM